ncbi:uncharacterized protein O3C94_019302 [Discoglossus pictus]
MQRFLKNKNGNIFEVPEMMKTEEVEEYIEEYIELPKKKVVTTVKVPEAPTMAAPEEKAPLIRRKPKPMPEPAPEERAPSRITKREVVPPVQVPEVPPKAMPEERIPPPVPPPPKVPEVHKLVRTKERESTPATRKEIAPPFTVEVEEVPEKALKEKVPILVPKKEQVSKINNGVLAIYVLPVTKKQIS